MGRFLIKTGNGRPAMDNTFPKRMILTRDECSALKIPRWWAGIPLDRIRLRTIRKNKK